MSFIKKWGFKDGWIGCPPLQTIALKNFKQGNRKQYGLKYRVIGTIHSAIGDTLSHMVTEISSTQSRYSLWDKGQFIVLLSRTKFAKKTFLCWK